MSHDLDPQLPPALLAMEDGTVYRGAAFGARGEAHGEVVFNTAITGYQEVLTDPSYRGQIVVMTAPEIGNVGINERTRVGAAVALGLRGARAVAARLAWRAPAHCDELLDARRRGHRGRRHARADAPHPPAGAHAG